MDLTRIRNLAIQRLPVQSRDAMAMIEEIERLQAENAALRERVGKTNL